MLAATFKISRTLSILLSRDVQVNSYLTPLWTAVAQHPRKLQRLVLAMYIGAALYRIRITVINCTAFNVLPSRLTKNAFNQ